MKLCLIIHSLEAGGAERVLSLLANYWASRHEVHIITFRAPDTKPHYPLSPSITLHQLGTSHRLTSFRKALSVLPSGFRLRQTVKDISPDRVISFVDLMNVFSLVALKGLGIPHIVSERTNPTQHSVSWILKLLRWVTYRWAQKIIFQTPYAAQYFHGLKNSEIIPNPIITPTFLHKKEIDSTKVISMGRLDKPKNHACLINAFAQIADRFPQWTLSIYGEGSERKALQTLIDSLNLSKRITLEGQTSRAYEELARSGLFVLPSLYEGFPNALAEAMAVGLPVIGSDIPGNTDLIQDGLNGLVFKSGDENDLVTQLSRLMGNKDLRARLGAKAQKIIDLYGEDKVYPLWDKIVDWMG